MGATESSPGAGPSEPSSSAPPKKTFADQPAEAPHAVKVNEEINPPLEDATTGLRRSKSFHAAENSLFSDEKVSTDDFEILKVVGDGYYGKARHYHGFCASS